MNKNFLIAMLSLVSLSCLAQVQTATFTITPPTFNATDEITITVADVDPSLWGETDIYLWAWYYDLNDNFVGDSPTNGSWSNSDESQKFTNNGNGTFSYTLTPSTFYGDPNIGRMGMLAKADDGSDMGNGERKTQDHYVEVGLFQVLLNSPTQTNTVVNSGASILVSATSSVNANFQLFANGSSINTQNNITNYTHNPIINTDTYFELVVTDPVSSGVITKTFNVILTPNPQLLAVPSGMVDGINLDPGNPDTATLVLYAPNKDFVHVMGNFNDNDWRLTNTYLLNKDNATNRHWITLSGLSSGDADVLFQYVVDAEITVADPYSTYVLSQFNDPFIDQTTFPDLPSYPVNKTEHLVSWFTVGEVPYVWQVNNFERPKQEDLVIYELLIRDFDALHSYDALIDRLDYIEDLGVNAIELMPVNEFDGNISWGYNPSFHMALDKYYGTKNDFKAFIDECHARGIAVILDVVYNHATGQNSYYRMWNDCNGCYGGQATTENPFFNVNDPNTTFQFFNDIDHESNATQQYIDRLNDYWLDEFRIDGYRFDFTKGFTNTVGDGGSYDASRIALLERMYDEIRDIDLTAYVILEHFAPNSEETELIEYRATADPLEPGMLVWGNHNHNYNEATMGYHNDSDFSWISYLNRGWDTPSSVGYMESHDEERLNYKNLTFGNSNGAYDIRDLETALDRMELAGAFYFTIPGPKMIWQFGELGYDYSINYCQDGTIDPGCRVDPKPIAWDLNYHLMQGRLNLYFTWRKIIEIANVNPIFSTDDFTIDAVESSGLKKIQLQDLGATGSDIKYVTILGNFGVTEQSIVPNFQETGSWFDMYTGNNITVANVNDPILLQAGEYKIYANEMPVLNSSENDLLQLQLIPNPADLHFRINSDISKLSIYDISGKLIDTIEDYKAGSQINVEHYDSGIYLIKALSNSKTYHLKFLKK